MIRVRLKDVRQAGTEEFSRRLRQWQEEHKTTGLPSAHALGLRCIAYSAGIYGCNGHLYVTEGGEVIGGVGYAVYVY